MENRSKNRIVVETYLDTIPSLEQTNMTEYYLEVVVEPYKSKKLFKVGNTKGWSMFIESSVNNRLNLFVFQVDSLEILGIDSLIAMGAYDKYIFSESELDKINWKIVIE